MQDCPQGSTIARLDCFDSPDKRLAYVLGEYNPYRGYRCNPLDATNKPNLSLNAVTYIRDEYVYLLK